MADTKDAARPAAKDDTKAADKPAEKTAEKGAENAQGSDRQEVQRPGGLQDVPGKDFPLTVTVFNDELDREIHRTQVDYGRAYTDWTDLISKDLPSGDLDHRFPGKKKVTVTDVNGKVVHEA